MQRSIRKAAETTIRTSTLKHRGVFVPSVYWLVVLGTFHLVSSVYRRLARARPLQSSHDFLSHIRGIIWNVAVILLIAITVYALYKETFPDRRTVEFRVHSHVTEEGFETQTVKQRLIDEISKIHLAADSKYRKGPIAPLGIRPDFVVPSTGLSIQATAAYLRTLYRGSFLQRITKVKPPKVVSAQLIATGDNGGLLLHLRIDERNVRVKSATDEDVIFRKGARHIVKEVEPYILAAYHFRTNDFARARDLLYLILTKHPGTESEAWAVNLLGILDHRVRKFDDAINNFRKATELNPEFAGAYYNWGNALFKKNKHKDAIKRHQQAVALDPDLVATYHVSWGNALFSRGDHGEAIKKYKVAVAFDPDLVAGYHNWGNALLSQSNPGAAIKMYEKAIQVDPEFAPAYHDWGNALFIGGDYEGAIKKYKMAIQFDPELARAHYNWGNALFNKREYNTAIEMYEKAIQFDPDLARAHYDWGNALFNKHQYDAAIKQYKKATDLNPGFAEAYHHSGNAFFSKADYDSAIRMYKTATELNDRFAEAYNDWGYALAAKGDYEKAIMMYERAIELNPKFAEAYRQRGLALERRSDYDGAVKAYEKAVELDPERFDDLRNRIVSLRQKASP